MTARQRYDFDSLCNGLVQSVRDAAAVEWVPYRGDLTREAVWMARRAMRQARTLGLYPTIDARLEHHDDPGCGCRDCRAKELDAAEPVGAARERD